MSVVMCIICLEFNRTRDLEDARRMVEAARREADVVPEELKKVAKELEKRRVTETLEELHIDSEEG
ncbi:MAG: hypothetical protein ACOVS5_03430 [Oligoflexus sp.]